MMFEKQNAPLLCILKGASSSKISKLSKNYYNLLNLKYLDQKNKLNCFVYWPLDAKD